MVWVIGGIVVILIVGAISSIANKAEETQKRLEFNERSRSRVDAYVDYIRRVSAHPDFARMSDSELKDIISQKIREYKTQINGAYTVCALILVAAVAYGAFIGFTKSSWQQFVVLSIIGLIGSTILSKIIVKRIDAKFVSSGFEPEKLKVED